MLNYTIRIHGTHQTYDIPLKQKKSEGTERFINRVYNRVALEQRGLFNTIKVELFNDAALVDTVYGLIDKARFYNWKPDEDASDD
jgi:hypothetical protein